VPYRTKPGTTGRKRSSSSNFFAQRSSCPVGIRPHGFPHYPLKIVLFHGACDPCSLYSGNEKTPEEAAGGVTMFVSSGRSNRHSEHTGLQVWNALLARARK